MTQVVERSGSIDHDTRRYLDHFERFQAARDGQEPAWLSRIRTEAIARFGELGFPTTRQEEWRFTSVAPIAETSFDLAGPILSVIGQPAGVRLEPLASLLATSPEVVQPHLARLASFANHPFIAWNTAFFQDGVFVGIPSNLVVELPLEIVFTSPARQAPTVSHPRVVIVAGENSQVRIVERYVGSSGPVYFTNAVTEVVVGPHAVIDHYKVQE
ncbi:MAG: SufD family Fe-S cluster assembly protein, partial [Acidimicrobiia bacterium]